MSIYIAHRHKSASNAFNVPSILIKKTRLQCTTKTVKNSQFACQSRLWGDLFLQIVVLQVFSCGRQFLVKFILIRPEFSHKLVKPLRCFTMPWLFATCPPEQREQWTKWQFSSAMKIGTWHCVGLDFSVQWKLGLDCALAFLQLRLVRCHMPPEHLKQWSKLQFSSWCTQTQNVVWFKSGN